MARVDRIGALPEGLWGLADRDRVAVRLGHFVEEFDCCRLAHLFVEFGDQSVVVQGRWLLLGWSGLRGGGHRLPRSSLIHLPHGGGGILMLDDLARVGVRAQRLELGREARGAGSL